MSTSICVCFLLPVFGTYKLGKESIVYCQMLRELYSGPIESVSKQLGLHPHFRKIYYIRRYSSEYYYLKTNDSYSADINGLKAKFSVGTITELNRLKKVNRNKELQLILEHIESDDIYWDIGANIGTHTIFPAKSLSEGSVVSIEPHPENVKSLRKNIQMNDLDNVSVEEAALGEKNGTVELNVEGGSAGSGGHSIETDEGEDYINVPMVEGDSLLEEYSPPDVIKMDVQAAELKVLQGLKNVMGESCRLVFCEAHRRRGVDVEQVVDFFRNRGFDVDIPEDSGNTAQLVAKKD